MKTTMSMTGVGPKIALTTLPYMILAIVVINREPQFLALNFLNHTISQIIGYSLLVIGVIFYLMTAKTFFSHFKKGELITSGPFALCRNPIYGTFIVFVVPSLAFIFRSGMILSIDVVLYLNFKMFIGEEYSLLRYHFKDEYDRYEKAVNEILPIPKFKK